MNTDRPSVVHRIEPTDRVAAAVAELVDALRAEIADAARHPDVERLLSIAEAAETLGISRTALYSAIESGRLRSVKVGRRRLIPASALAELTEVER
jgi:excisionase family DNA binding protein